MKYRELGQTGKEVSEICFGGWQIGGKEWGHISQREAEEAVNVALECGVNFFDTADYYGDGRSEEILGNVLSSKKSHVLLATKGGIIKGKGAQVGFNGRPDYLRSALKNSLRRLNTDCIDLYQLHWPDPKVPVEDSVGELWNLQKEGHIKHIGVSNFTLEELIRACGVARIESIQPSYNMFFRDIEDAIVPYCEKEQISILPYNPLARGLLAGKYHLDTLFEDHRKNDLMFQGEKYRINIETVDALKTIATTHSMNILDLVLSWTLKIPSISSVITGIRNTSQIYEICHAEISTLTDDTLAAVQVALNERSGKLKKHLWYLEVGKFFLRNKEVRRRIYNIYVNLRRV